MDGIFFRRKTYFYVFFSRRIVSGERVMAAHFFLRKGAVVPAHSHESEQLTLPDGVFRGWVGAGGFVVGGARCLKIRGLSWTRIS